MILQYCRFFLYVTVLSTFDGFVRTHARQLMFPDVLADADFLNIHLTVSDGRRNKVDVNENAKNESTVPYKVSPTDTFGKASGSPCCLYRDGRTDCFVRSFDSSLLHGVIYDGKSAEWSTLDKYVVGDVSCIYKQNGEIDVMGVNVYNVLEVRTLTKHGWKSWIKTAARDLMEAPSCVSRTPRNVDCMYRGADNAAYMIGSMDGIWEYTIRRAGGVLMGPITCVAETSTAIDCYSTRKDHRLQVYSWDETRGVRPWRPIGHLPVMGKLSVTTHGGRSRDVFTIGIYNTMLWKSYDIDGNVQPWERLGVHLGFAPDCLEVEGTIHCFAVSLDARLMHASWKGGDWKIKAEVEKHFAGTPSCHVQSFDAIVCYVRSLDTSTIHQYIFSP